MTLDPAQRRRDAGEIDCGRDVPCERVLVCMYASGIANIYHSQPFARMNLPNLISNIQRAAMQGKFSGHADSFNKLNAVAATTGICPFPMTLSSTIAPAIPSTTLLLPGAVCQILERMTWRTAIFALTEPSSLLCKSVCASNQCRSRMWSAPKSFALRVIALVL